MVYRYESVSDNPYLADFYEDMSQWAFHLQVFFIGHRAEQYLELYQSPQSTISDRSIYEDAHIFARALHHMGAFTERDHAAYRRTFNLVVNSLPKPDLLLYLKCPVPVLMKRIRQRGREMENNITAEYLSLLESFYNEWLHNFDLCPMLVIPSENLDFCIGQGLVETLNPAPESRLQPVVNRREPAEASIPVKKRNFKQSLTNTEKRLF
ncbi:MAG: deoxynucleoside kinase [Chloroflexi bacterium]|nr:deoxynucleoside kinase [Chloroflexota bacterium]